MVMCRRLRWGCCLVWLVRWVHGDPRVRCCPVAVLPRSAAQQVIVRSRCTHACSAGAARSPAPRWSLCGSGCPLGCSGALLPAVWCQGSWWGWSWVVTVRVAGRRWTRVAVRARDTRQRCPGHCGVICEVPTMCAGASHLTLFHERLSSRSVVHGTVSSTQEQGMAGIPDDQAHRTGQPEPVSGFEDSPGSPWCMTLVLNMPRDSPPARTAAAETAATATLTLLSDMRAVNGEWTPAVTRWLSGKIRKHCRYTRGAGWQRIQQVPGITVSRGGVGVRACVPMALDARPDELTKRTQLLNTELPTVPAAAPGQREAGLLVSITPTPWLSSGKAIVAAAHAAQLAWMRMPPAHSASWAEAGFPLVVEHPDPGLWALRVSEADVEVIDAGLLETPANTRTACAHWLPAIR